MEQIKYRMFFKVVKHYKTWDICLHDTHTDKHIRVGKVTASRRDPNKYNIKIYEFKYMYMVFKFLERKELFGFTNRQELFEFVNC